MGRHRILVADDHRSIHAIVRRILEPDFDVIACVPGGPELLRLAPAHQPDVLIVDVCMAGGGGIEVVRSLYAVPEAPCWQTVILTTYNDLGILRETRNAGALGYVLKCRAGEELPTAVRAVLLGREFVSPAVLHRAS